MGLGPASEPPLAVSRVSSQVQGCAAARGAPRGAFVPFSPPLSQCSARKADLARRPLGCTRGVQGNLCPGLYRLRTEVSVWRARLTLEWRRPWGFHLNLFLR